MPRRSTSAGKGKAKPKPKSKAKAKSQAPYQSYASLDWGRIRREYETTTVSMGEICRRYGIRSDGTLRKRMKADGGWTKNVDAMAANLVQGAIAAEAGDELSPLFAGGRPAVVIEGQSGEGRPELGGSSPEGEKRAAGRRATRAARRRAIDHTLRTSPAQSENTKAQTSNSQNSHQPAPGAPAPTGMAPRAPSTGDRSLGGSAGGEAGDEVEPLLEVPIPPEDLADAEAVRTASGLADMHVAAVRRQLLAAQRLGLVTNVVLARIFVAVSATTAEDGAEARGALMFLNPERETLAGLLKACSDTMERAAAMERRALGMDPKTGSTPPAAPEPPVPINQVSIERMVVGLPTDVLMALRGAATSLAKLPPTQRPAAKAAAAGAEPAKEGEPA